MLPLNYLGALYFSLCLIFLIHLFFPSAFQTSHREPSHSFSLVHRSLAKSTLADWSASKRDSHSGPFDPFLGLLGQGENSPHSDALNAPLLAHSTLTCTVLCKKKKKNIFFSILFLTKSRLSTPSPRRSHVTNHLVTKCVSLHKTISSLLALQFAKSLSHVYLNITKEPIACQSPVDGQKDMSSH